jgi:three-Cys-motif partner protein
VSSTSNYYQSKKPWSLTKDKLLESYLVPYFQKMLMTQRPNVYIDCFAGKGKFDDGQDGSPLIALKAIKDCYSRTSNPNAPQTKMYFVDERYYEDLERNSSAIQLPRQVSREVVAGSYQDNISQLLGAHQGSNLFLYLDPYGVKDLDFDVFSTLPSSGFATQELLINLNTIGFLRNACRALKATPQKLEELDAVASDLVEEDDTQAASMLKPAKLSRIAGGDYWSDIAHRFIRDELEWYEAERLFSQGYCDKMRGCFAYVLNMPISFGRTNYVKYRLVHATNHPDGCYLMYSNMCKRFREQRRSHNNGDDELFVTVPNDTIQDEDRAKELFRAHVSDYGTWERLTTVIADFLTQHSLVCEPAVLERVVRDLESAGAITVRRSPATTNTGKPSRFLTESNKQSVWIRSA